MKTAVRTLRHTVEAFFWRSTVFAVGLAAHHRRGARLIPLVVLAASAFVLGRAAGIHLLNGF